jgi:hypothetical protein
VGLKAINVPAAGNPNEDGPIALAGGIFGVIR